MEKKEHSLDGAKGAYNRIEKEFTKWKEPKAKGISGFGEIVQDKVNNLIAKCKNYGLFIVPVGELEGWMDLGVKKKNKWIIPALQKIYNKECSENLRGFVGELIAFIGD